MRKLSGCSLSRLLCTAVSHCIPTMNLQFRVGERKRPSGIDFPLLRVTECRVATFIFRGLLPLLPGNAEKKIHALCHGDLYTYYNASGEKSVIARKTNIPRVYREIYVNLTLNRAALNLAIENEGKRAARRKIF